VKRDLSDLVTRAQWVRSNPEEAQQIGRAGRAMATRVLTRDAAVQRWAATLSSAARTPSGAWAPPELLEAVTPVLQRFGAPGVSASTGGAPMQPAGSASTV
jgi:hypothetical protein